MNLSTRFSSSSSTHYNYYYYHFYRFLPRNSPPDYNNLIPNNSSLIFSPVQNPSFSILKLKSLNNNTSNSKLTHTFAVEGEEKQKHQIQLNGVHQSTEKNENENDDDELEFSGGMAKAFGISSNTASAISICIAILALASPILMKSLSGQQGLKTKAMSYVTLLFGFYMAWNIGANDVANAMGTSVGSGALTLRQAVVTAGVLEFAGALMMGTHVTSTMQNGILVANVFQGNNTLLLAGLLSSLAAAASWLQVLTN